MARGSRLRGRHDHATASGSKRGLHNENMIKYVNGESGLGPRPKARPRRVTRAGEKGDRARKKFLAQSYTSTKSVSKRSSRGITRVSAPGR